MKMIEILSEAVKRQASDIFLVAGLPLSIKSQGTLVHLGGDKLLPADTETLIREIYALAGDRAIQTLLETGDDDFSFAVSGRQVPAFRFPRRMFMIRTRTRRVTW